MSESEDPHEIIRKLKLENEELKKTNQKKIEIKVSTKGCVQINGIRRFPFTFYTEELKTILKMNDQLEEFMKDNVDELATK